MKSKNERRELRLSDFCPVLQIVDKASFYPFTLYASLSF